MASWFSVVPSAGGPTNHEYTHQYRALLESMFRSAGIVEEQMLTKVNKRVRDVAKLERDVAKLESVQTREFEQG